MVTASSLTKNRKKARDPEAHLGNSPCGGGGHNKVNAVSLRHILGLLFLVRGKCPLVAQLPHNHGIHATFFINKAI